MNQVFQIHGAECECGVEFEHTHEDGTLKHPIPQLPQRKESSEFGQGLCYNLGLFLCHADKLRIELRQYREWRKKDNPENYTEDLAVSRWFNGAGDHFFDFLPEYAPKHLQERCKILRDKCLDWRLPMDDIKEPTLKDADWAIQEAKDLLRLIDEDRGVPTIKGEWE